MGSNPVSKKQITANQGANKEDSPDTTCVCTTLGGLHVLGRAHHRGLRHDGGHGDQRHLPGPGEEIWARHGLVVEGAADLWHERSALAPAHHVGRWGGVHARAAALEDFGRRGRGLRR